MTDQEIRNAHHANPGDCPCNCHHPMPCLCIDCGGDNSVDPCDCAFDD